MRHRERRVTLTAFFQHTHDQRRDKHNKHQDWNDDNDYCFNAVVDTCIALLVVLLPGWTRGTCVRRRVIIHRALAMQLALVA